MVSPRVRLTCLGVTASATLFLGGCASSHQARAESTVRPNIGGTEQSRELRRNFRKSRSKVAMNWWGRLALCIVIVSAVARTSTPSGIGPTWGRFTVDTRHQPLSVIVSDQASVWGPLRGGGETRDSMGMTASGDI